MAKRDRTRLRRVWNTPSTVPILVVAGAVLLANLLYLTGVFDANPMAQYSNLTAHTTAGLLPGQNNIDPNQGFVSQALGHLAAMDWLHGHIPWWNPFEGLGMPLGGEMQSAALFFPLVILDAFANGQILFRMALELTAGISTFFLLRRLVRSQWAATAGAVVFALNGTFSWMFHAPANPVAFAPMLLLGIEQCRTEDRRGLRGWPLVAIAIALSIYAGFPEVAFIDGLFALMWAAIRASELRGADLVGYLRRLGAGAGTGVLLAAPALVAFLTFTQSADLLDHGGDAFLHVFMTPSVALPAVVMPYVYGPIFAFQSYDPGGAMIVDFWGNVGGYLGASLLVLGLVGLVGRRERRLRVALGVWLFLAIGRTVGVTGIIQLVNAVPGVKQTAFYRYSPPSWSLALVVLGVLAIDDLAARPERRKLIAAGAVSLLVIGYLAVRSTDLHHVITAAPGNWAWLYGSVAGAVAIVAGCVAAGLFVRRGQTRTLVLSAIVAVEALGLFVLPQFSAPRSASIDTAPVAFLQQHLGQQRFFTLGPLSPNYGSYFDIATVNLNDEPVVGSWSKYIAKSLDTNVLPGNFTGTVGADPNGPSPTQEFVANIDHYEATGVKYVIVPAGAPLPVVHGRALPVVFSDKVAQILQLPHPAPFQSATDGCQVTSSTAAGAVVDCTGPGTLIRLEQYMPGWSATDNGRSVAVSAHKTVFQSLPLRPGRNVVRFSFRPPHMAVGEGAAIIGLAILIMVGLTRSPRLEKSRSDYSPAHRRRTPAGVS